MRHAGPDAVGRRERRVDRRERAKASGDCVDRRYPCPAELAAAVCLEFVGECGERGESDAAALRSTSLGSVIGIRTAQARHRGT